MDMILTPSAFPGSQHSLDRGVRCVHHSGLCFVLWGSCPAAGRHVGVQTQQYVCSNSAVKLWYNIY